MGFIGKIFGAVFGFIGAIFGTIAKLLGLGGKSDYYVELDGSQSAVPESAKEPVAKVAESSSTTKLEAAPPVKSESSLKAGSSSGQANAEGKDKEVKAQPVAQKPSDPTEIIMAAVSKPSSSTTAESHQQNGKAGEDMTFAPEQLMTLSSTGRRRPGPSLSPFKVMARQVQRSS